MYEGEYNTQISTNQSFNIWTQSYVIRFMKNSD